MKNYTCADIRPQINVSKVKDSYLWVAFVERYSPWPAGFADAFAAARRRGQQVNPEDLGAVPLDTYLALLQQRFGYVEFAGQGSADWERHLAETTLALLIAEGSSSSIEQAIADATAAAQVAAPDLGQPEVRWRNHLRRTSARIPASSQVRHVKAARTLLDRLARLEHLAQSCEESSNVAPAYIYVRGDRFETESCDHPARIHRHRIQRQTKALVFIDSASDSRQWGQGWDDIDVRRHLGRSGSQGSIRLKKVWLDGTEKMPWVSQRNLCSGFDGIAWEEGSLRPLEEPRRYAVPAGSPDLVLLGLTAANLTVATAKKAYRALAKQHHPDAGGDAQLFAELDAAYKRVTAVLPRETR